MQRLMQAACAEAQASWRDGGVPVGAVLAQRWEEAWERPLADWREQLGITALVERSPFRLNASRA